MIIVSTSVGKNPLKEVKKRKVAIIVHKRIQNAVLGCNLKNDRMISVSFQGKPFNITVIQVYALTSNAEEAEVERFCFVETYPLKSDYIYHLLSCSS